MGVFISLKLSDTITKKEWTPVYENKKLMTYKPSEMFKFLAEDMPENTVAVAEKTRYITKKKKLDNRYIIKSKSGYFYYENGSYKKMEDQNAK